MSATSTIDSSSSPDSTVDGVATSSVPSLPSAPTAPAPNQSPSNGSGTGQVIHLGHALTLVNPSFEIINNTFVLGPNDGQLITQMNADGTQQINTEATATGISFLIDQQGSGNILQLQNNEQDRFLVASSGSVTILANATSSTTNLLTVSNASTSLFTINSVGDLTTTGHITVGKDTAGTATIKAGDNVTKVTFDIPYGSVPKIIASPIDTPVLFAIKDVAETGFTIVVSQPVTTDVSFNWFVVQQPQDTPSQSSLSVAPSSGSQVIITPPTGDSGSGGPASPAGTQGGQVAGTSTPPTDASSTPPSDSSTTPPASPDQTPPPSPTDSSSTTPPVTQSSDSSAASATP